MFPLRDKLILDVGCGYGFGIREFIRWGARPENMTGIDLLPERCAEARHLCPSSVKLHCGNAMKLNFDDSSFDIVVQMTVFTSILDSSMKQKVAAEMVRVLKPDGFLLWYDYFLNNPRNPDARGVNKREIRRLFPGCRIDLRRNNLAPPLARSFIRHSWLACYLLNKLPFLRTHYVGAIRKP